jgi:hypothetical protein
MQAKLDWITPEKSRNGHTTADQFLCSRQTLPWDYFRVARHTLNIGTFTAGSKWFNSYTHEAK